ncbi:hypothetical protein QYM36_015891 [Artemia franciscana]|uniref:Uncharacterized protein n=1 Tax=Artemia franciscana TaxID=6661 RepID=A0AA88H8P7_ARTSF|nr:hypothetical protein QYM36_015891 [Artemia franciscana]
MRTSDPDDGKSSHLSVDGFYEFSEDESDSSQSNSAVNQVKDKGFAISRKNGGTMAFLSIILMCGKFFERTTVYYHLQLLL